MALMSHDSIVLENELFNQNFKLIKFTFYSRIYFLFEKIWILSCILCSE